MILKSMTIIVLILLQIRTYIPQYTLGSIIHIDNLQKVAMNDDGSIIATLTSTISGANLKIDYYNGNSLINTTQTQISIKVFFHNWLVKINNNGDKIFVMSNFTTQVQVYGRNQDGTYTKSASVIINQSLYDFSISQDGNLVVLTNCYGKSWMYKFSQNSQRYQLTQEFDLSIDWSQPNIINHKLINSRMTQDQNYIMFKAQYGQTVNYEYFQALFIYSKKQNTDLYQLDIYSNLINLYQIKKIQVGKNGTKLFLQTNKGHQIYQRNQQNNLYKSIQNFRQCLQLGRKDAKITKNGELLFILCQNPINSTLIYKLNTQINQYERVNLIQDVGATNILISNDGRKIILVDMKKGNLTLGNIQCSLGQFYLNGQCLSCTQQYSQRPQCQSGNLTILLLEILIPIIAFLIIIGILIFIFVRRYLNKRKMIVSSSIEQIFSNQLKKDNTNETFINQLEEASIHSFLDQINKSQTKCILCQKYRISHMTPCLHLFHYSCIQQWLKKQRSCPICAAPLKIQMIAQIDSLIENRKSISNIKDLEVVFKL